ncbi:hypothetical protein TSAR_004679 [Trichomalopsis sarcophagae]|uniref:VWFC domain-containing protein n=1 Tax=Trichomalopsis sarcophagae TaxID=543379 RepID=A0A232EMS1_9HYME|nr:hypothetical protein TSAR_004679 [Trichomalopsis sarcophagae]
MLSPDSIVNITTQPHDHQRVLYEFLSFFFPATTRAAESNGVSCPEDSVPGDDGECKCVSPVTLPCPRHKCQAGQKAVQVRDADPERPGSCCPLYECRSQEDVIMMIPEDSGNVHCRDESGHPRELNEHWQSDDFCTNCTCEVGGPHCQSVMCRGCDHPLPPAAGECCPRCGSPPVATSDRNASLDTGCRALRDCKLRCEFGLDVDRDGCTFCRCRDRPQAADESRGWGTIQIVLVVVLALLCVLLMVHLVHSRFRARLAPSEADFAGYPQQYYKCVPVYEGHHVPVLRHAEKIVSL